MRIHILTPVWGASFTDMFLRFVLPCLASEGNLPALAREHELTFQVYSDATGARAISSSPLVNRLSSFMAFEYPDCDGQPIRESMKIFDRLDSTHYQRSAACLLDGLKRAWNEHAGILFIAPDNIYSDGALERVKQAIRAGSRGVLLSSMAVRSDTFLSALDEQVPLNPAGTRTVKPRSLAHMGLVHRHPWMEGAYLDGPSFNLHSSLYWPVEEEGYLARAWHLQPLFLHPQRPVYGFFISQDNDLVDQIIEDVRDLEIIQDSDKITLIDIHPPDSNRFCRTVKDPFSPLRYALAAEQVYVSPQNFFNVRHGLRFHDRDPSPAWEARDRESDAILDEIQGWMTFLDPSSWRSPRALDPAHRSEAQAMLAHFQDQAAGTDPMARIWAWANLGKLHAAMGHRDEALRAFEKELELRPEAIRSTIRIAWAALALDATDLADRAIAQAMALDPGYFELESLKTTRSAAGKD